MEKSELIFQTYGHTCWSNKGQASLPWFTQRMKFCNDYQWRWDINERRDKIGEERKRWNQKAKRQLSEIPFVFLICFMLLLLCRQLLFLCFQDYHSYTNLSYFLSQAQSDRNKNPYKRPFAFYYCRDRWTGTQCSAESLCLKWQVGWKKSTSVGAPLPLPQRLSG